MYEEAWLFLGQDYWDCPYKKAQKGRMDGSVI